MMRTLPVVNEDDALFWKGGADGKLHFPQCQQCRYIVHPPAPVCPHCHGRELSEITVSGEGTVETFTLNYQPWMPDMQVPFAIAIVTLDEQDDLRLMSNVVNIEPDQVKIGMRVSVVFEACEEGIYLPLFEPLKAAV
jgi:uncharacterized OB-fold protein